MTDMKTKQRIKNYKINRKTDFYDIWIKEEEQITKQQTTIRMRRTLRENVKN